MGESVCRGPSSDFQFSKYRPLKRSKAAIVFHAKQVQITIKTKAPAASRAPSRVASRLRLGHQSGDILGAERTDDLEVANRSWRLPRTLDVQQATRRAGSAHCQVGYK
jgi:hypothetical protein